MWEKTTLIFTWNNKPSTYYYIYIVESQDVKQTFGFCILYWRKSVTAENSIIYASATFPDLAKCVL